MRVPRFFHEFRTGWHQGVINRAEERVARPEAILASMGEKPHRPSGCLLHQPSPAAISDGSDQR